MTRFFEHSPFLNEKGREYEQKAVELFEGDVEVWGATIALAHRLRSEWEPHRDHPQELYSALLFARLTEQTEAVILLAMRGFWHMGDAAVRIAAETLFSLKAACEDPELAKQLMNQGWIDRKRFSKALLGSEDDRVCERKADYEQALAEAEEEIEKQDIRPLPTFEIAKRADMQRLYDVVYRAASAHVHPSLSSLEKYFELDDEGEVAAMVVGPKDHSIARQIQAATEFLLLAIDCVGGAWSLKKPNGFDVVARAFKQRSREEDLDAGQQKALSAAVEQIRRGGWVDGDESLEDLRDPRP